MSSTSVRADGTGDTPTGAAPNYPIGSVDSALQLLRIFSEQKTVRIADASRELGVARSTVHRMVQQLQYRGFVSQDPETRMYIAGPDLIRMALAIVHQLDIRTVAVPVMQRLARSTGETVHIAELRGSQIFFLNSVESPRSVRVGSRTGMTMFAHATSSGKVLLAELNSDQLRDILPTPKLPALTGKTHTSRKALEQDLVRVREQGYAVNIGESEDDVSALAVPVRDTTGCARAALAIAAPPTRLSEDSLPRLVEELQAGAAEIGASMPI